MRSMSIEECCATVIEAEVGLLEREAALVEQLREIGARGPFECVPREEFQGRGRRYQEYMYLVFPCDGKGGYCGPGRKQKVYVGAKPAAIKAARDRVAATGEHLAVLASLDETRLAVWRLRVATSRLGRMAAAYLSGDYSRTFDL